MLEFVNGLLLVLCVISVVAFVIVIWAVWIEGDNNISKASLIGTILVLIITLGIGYASYYTSTKLKIIEAEATVTSFEELRKQFGDNYIVEPETNSNYAKAIATLEKYDKLGIYSRKK